MGQIPAFGSSCSPNALSNLAVRCRARVSFYNVDLPLMQFSLCNFWGSEFAAVGHFALRSSYVPGGVRAQRVPTVFRGVLQNLTVEIGRTATFACDILTSETTGWKHNGDLVYLKEKPMSGGTESRYSTNYVSHVGTHVLRIANVTADDDGPVECIVKWGNGDNDWTKSTAHLTVLGEFVYQR